MVSFFRIVKFALEDIFRNFSLSVMTVVILVLMLLSVNTLVVVQAITTQAIASVKEHIDVSIHFQHEATEEHISEVRSYVESFPEVLESQFFTKEQVLEQFKQAHQADSSILTSLEELEENPLGSTLVVKTREPSDYEKIITAISVPEYEHIVEAKTFNDVQTSIEKIDTITRRVEESVIFLSILFTLIAFFVTFNTIRVAIYTQRLEIGIKKLVGATNWFIRGPYIIESVIFTICSMFVAGVLVYHGLAILDPYLEVVFGQKAFLQAYFGAHAAQLIGIEFAGVFALTVFTSGIAIRKYLRT
ncbi:MAG: hypothetical protein HOJ25_01200 [Candidatus Magasanikbacteria bacterium]|jgi:cell division transport system permease protein|nr:hypothetical protein [Candidatus Magasanikbacteria bacterium]MBT5819856.1 hypothetical protein [Candidatus Magasanikbacteria bacterium]MBT6294286.1 hypothetical protein [Candidatus Magasanikbacteria bacterium]